MRGPGHAVGACAPARFARETILSGFFAPVMAWYVRRRIEGREVFDGLKPPVIFVANHSSHMDTPTILRALPRQWRQRTAVAAAADYFYRKRWVAAAVSLLFAAVPISRRGGGMDKGSARPPAPRCSTSAGTSCCIRRAPARATARAASCTPAPRSSPPRTTSRSCRSSSRGRARRCRPAAPGRAACAPGAPSVASRSACASARRSARSRVSTATRRWPACRLVRRPGRPRPSAGAPLAPAAPASAEERPMTPVGIPLAAPPRQGSAEPVATSSASPEPGPGAPDEPRTAPLTCSLRPE